MRIRPLRESSISLMEIAIITAAMLIVVASFVLGYHVGLSKHSNDPQSNPEFAASLAASLSAANTTGGSNANTVTAPNADPSAAIKMPKDRINESQIKVYSDKVEIDLQNAEWSKFTATKSMVPFLDQGAYAIQIVPSSPSDLQVGDIISYQYSDGSIIIHRIIKTGNDSQGWYAIVQGDNNAEPDPLKVRFSQVKRVLVAIIY